MKKLIIMLAGLGVAAGAFTGTANAAPTRNYAPYESGWQGIDARQNEIKNNIASGIKTGALTRNEAWKVQVKFQQLASLEAQYRRTGRGLDGAERADLQRRFDALQRSVRAQKNDRQHRGYRG